tara:strand:- start:528 stop:632 length:105 start_codon:yes stop_codon:yes gene_type:complete
MFRHTANQLLWFEMAGKTAAFARLAFDQQLPFMA